MTLHDHEMTIMSRAEMLEKLEAKARQPVFVRHDDSDDPACDNAIDKVEKFGSGEIQPAADFVDPLIHHKTGRGTKLLEREDLIIEVSLLRAFGDARIHHCAARCVTYRQAQGMRHIFFRVYPSIRRRPGGL